MGRAQIAIVVSQLLLVAGLSSESVWAGDQITAAEASSHVGRRETVCGRIVGAKYASSTRGQPTFLDFGRPYPNSLFTVVVWGSDRAKFDTPPETLTGTSVCASGTIELFRGRAEIIVHDPAHLTAGTGNERR
jgi:DNA/RNA endonuclease YhcR with UshA esterase domain